MRFQRLFATSPPGVSRRCRWRALRPAIAMACVFLTVRLPAADNTPGQNTKVENPKTEKPLTDARKPRLPDPEEVGLTTDDGLRLALSYYPGIKSREVVAIAGGTGRDIVPLATGKGKETVPVVLLHMWTHSRAEFQNLAIYLQSQGYAVIVPDLRGHGQSTRFKGTEKDEDLKAASMLPSQYGRMVTEDMKAVKDFLWERNNAGELNLDKLCLVGAEMGAAVAVEFAAFDATGYNDRMLSYGPLKLGGFVKALVLISPEWSFKSLSLKHASTVPTVQRDMSVLILVGKQDSRALADARRVEGVFERHRREPVGDDNLSKKTLFFVPLNTGLQGTKLLDPKFQAMATIAEFINRRLVSSDASREWTWKARKRPHE